VDEGESFGEHRIHASGEFQLKVSTKAPRFLSVGKQSNKTIVKQRLHQNNEGVGSCQLFSSFSSLCAM